MKRAIIDFSSVLWTQLLGGEDKEFGRKYRAWGDVMLPLNSEECRAKMATDGEGKKVTVNSAQYGYDASVQHILEVIEELKIQPRDTILVLEGMNAKAERQAFHPGYKAGRDKLPEQYEEFNKAKQMLVDNLTAIGMNVFWQDGGVEADDVIAYLAKHLDGEKYVISGDKDLAALVDPKNGVHHWRQGRLDTNPFGDFAHAMIPVYIALVGDSVDKIPGATGFGEKTFWEMMGVFGDDCLPLMQDLITSRSLNRLVEDLAAFPKLQKIVDSADQVYMSYLLGSLRHDRVNTVKRPLQYKAGMVKLREQISDRRLHKYAGVVRLVHAENYKDAVEWTRTQIEISPCVALDIETSTPPESDEWLERLDKSEDKTPVDVFGSELTGLGLTFGPNMQYTVYLTHDHVEEEGVTNLTREQVRDFVDMVPREKITYVHNAAFELPVLYNTWGEDWKDDEVYHGFLRNVRDTLIGASYVDENQSKGLKSLSKNVLGYEQESYQEVTTLAMSEEEYNDRCKVGIVGKVIQRAEEEGAPTLVQVQHKMNQLRAKEVLSYGADDTICTAALANIQRIIMEIEDTWSVYEEVETFPAYVTALAFVQGIDFSLQEMRELEKADDETYDQAWKVLREYLIKIGFEGTICPTVMKGEIPEDAPSHLIPFSAAGLKQVIKHVAGVEADYKCRNFDKIAKWLTQNAAELSEGDDQIEARLQVLAAAIDKEDVDALNEMLQRYFEGEPQLDLNSPKQMCHLLYDRLGLPVNITNDVTPLEHKHNPSLSAAIREHKKWRRGKIDNLTREEWALVRKKAKANDDAIDFALAFDQDYIDDEARAALKAIGKMKKVLTRRQLFYKNYWNLPHWKDGKLHPSLNQCAAVTRRYSANNPNVQQWPKKGEGVAFRGCVKPHLKDAVVCSIDYTGQELRLAAEESQDPNMLACYIGDRLKDIHSITAAGAMKLKWGTAVVKELMESYGQDLATHPDAEYELFVRVHKTLPKDKNDPERKRADDLRKEAKNVNFGAQNGAQDLKLSETLIMKPADAQLFLDAREKMFPLVGKAAKRAEQECEEKGYVTTMMGARRHLREAIASDDKAVASRAARQAWNFKIQGSAGEMTKIGMSRLWLSGALHRYRVQFMAPVHDELVSSVHKDDAVAFIREKNAAMTGPYANMKVPILASISLGRNFKDQIECGDWVIEENIRKAVNDCFAKEAA